MTEPLNWKDGLKIVLAVMTFGFGWIADNQMTVISFAAVLIVWLLGLALKYFGFTANKVSLTIILFIVALGLSLAFQPVALPSFPSWSGDASVFMALLVAYLASFFQIAAGVVAYATGVYNILMAQVLEKLPPITSRLWRRAFRG
jgi:uncharacterized membrane protein (DUF441 family)